MVYANQRASTMLAAVCGGARDRLTKGMGMGSRRRLAVCLAGVLLTLGVATRADGFRNPPATATALSKAGACTVWVDDASAVFYNPANLSDVSAPQLQLSGLVTYSGAEYRGVVGGTETEDAWAAIPAIALAWPLPREDLCLGLGIRVPYGRQTHWDEDGLFRYTAPVESEMSVIDISPALSWRALDCLSIGAGLDVYYGHLSFREFLPWPAQVGGGESRARVNCDDWALGANAGVTWQATERQRLALTCRLPFDMNFEGDMDVSGIPDPVQASGLATPHSDLNTSFAFPTIVTLGYGLQVTDTLRVEADVEWLEFSRYKNLEIDAGGNQALLDQAHMATTPQNWDDTWTFGVSAEWRFAEHWTLRTGYAYLDSPMPDTTFMPAMLDQSQSVIGLGIGYEIGRHRIDLAYACTILNTREVRGNQNPAYDGDYDFSGHLAALSYTLMF
jgi:long-chain fatty acid transport protein